MEQAERAHWEFDSSDQLRIQMLVEWGVTSLPSPGTVVLRLGYALSQQEWDVYQSTDSPPHQIQAAMSAADARELGRHLLLCADLWDVPAGSPNGST
ncbi:hypothetical protein [Pararhizobium sp. A13]|uniref:hypothetical protein n=1 Tax=Pararhizobium sp. A13 TaxID=3133975 RepID=UPI00311AD499